MKSRDEMPGALNELGLTGLGVEIGVFEGLFSETILRTWKGQTLFLVDTWDVLPGYVVGLGNADGTFFDTKKATAEDWVGVHQRCADRMEQFGTRAHMIHMPSVDAAKEFDDETLDFIYIDGDHSFRAVRADLRAWYPKLKKGGLFSGHDYNLRMKPGDFPVERAVMEFARVVSARPLRTREHETRHSWYWVKR